jgi:hypothetical protein
MFGKVTVEFFFPKVNTWKVEKVFDLVHTNICGPFTIKSFGGTKYFITFINDRNMTMGIRTLKTKVKLSNILGIQIYIE